MSEFAAFVLTKKSIYYLENSDSHEDIIENFQLRDDEVNLVRVIMVPSIDKSKASNPDNWTFRSCQQIYPDWTYYKDPTLEEITRKALAKRIIKQKIGMNLVAGIGSIITAGAFSQVEVGDVGQAISGYYGKAISGDEGYSMAGNYGKAISGEKGLAITNHCGYSKVGNFGTAISKLCGTSKAGNYGKAISGNHGQSVVGDNGIAITGVGGRAKAGENGEIQIQYFDNKRYRTIVGYVGENGIESRFLYKVENGLFVISEEF